MKRSLVVVAMVLLSVLFVALPAQAKGEHGDPLSGQAVITGPGIGKRIVIKGEFGFDGTRSLTNSFSSLLRDAGLLGTSSESGQTGSYGLAPDPAVLGPRYVIRYTFAIEEADPITQHMYPFAAEGPVFFNPAGQRSIFSGRLPSAWWIAPASILPFLVSHGLPATAPVPQLVEAPPATSLPASRTWVGVIAAAALMALLLAGALTARRRAVGSAA